MATCNIKKSQVIDIDLLNASSKRQANDYAESKGYSYFNFKNHVFIVGDMVSGYRPIATGFIPKDLVEG